jgi:hypothetical protein
MMMHKHNSLSQATFRSADFVEIESQKTIATARASIEKSKHLLVRGKSYVAAGGVILGTMAKLDVET